MPRSVPPVPGPTRVLVAAGGAAAVCVLPPFLLGAMAVQVRADLGFSEAGVGVAVGAFFATASLCSMLFGRRAERIGAERSLRVAALWTGLAQLAVAAGARSLTGLCVLLAVAGSANALGQPAANLFIAQATPVHRLGLAFAVKQSAVPFSTFIGGLAVPALALTAGWRWAFVVSAGLAAACALTVPPAPRRTSPPVARPDGPERAPRRAMAVLAVGMAFGAATAGTLGAFLVSAAVDVGWSPGSAGLILTAGSAFGIVMRLAMGVRADRVGRGHLQMVALMLAVGSLGYVAFAAGSQAVFLAGLPFAFGAGWAWPGLFNLAVVQANPASPAAATGITQTGTYFGAVAGPLGFGFLAERASYEVAWLVAAASCLVAAALIVMGSAFLRSGMRT